jgi:glycerol-3-phosphate dehydrogenase
MNRTEALAKLKSGAEAFDIVIVGGGATGLGAAVDAAARGHRVALVERGDFAQGTSSRSTKLVHGGVRYLRQGNVSLVLEALRERGRLARNAPHLVRDMSFIIPSYTWWERPFYGVGLTVYDVMAGSLGLGRSRVLSRDEAIAHLPTVETAGLRGGVLYHDGQFDDARLAVNLAQTAENLGATVVNYCRCTELVKQSGRVAGIVAVDGETGDEIRIRARAVINATGVFVDGLRAADDAGARPVVAVSQGIHLVLPKAFLPGNAALMVPKTADGRVLFAVPWHDRVVVGTTDTPIAGPSAEPRALDEERGFVMAHARKYLARDPSDSDVLSVFAGLRPLVRTGDASNTAALSRDHTILVSPSGLVTITGGKWTTYRKMAEDVIGQAEKVGGLAQRPSTTASMPVHGSRPTDDPTQPLAFYGSDAAGISEIGRREPSLLAQLHPALALTGAEVAWHVRREMARTVEDVLARRVRALLLDARASIEAAPAVAALMAREMGRDAAWAKAQSDAFTAVARGYCYMDPQSRAR